MSRPTVTASRHPLPFNSLSDRQFERLCYSLAIREGYTNVQHLGAGGSDRGQDLLAERLGRRVVFQCKKYKEFHPGHATAAIRKIIEKLPAAEQPEIIVLAVPVNVTEKTRKEAKKEAGSRNCLFWDLTFLDDAVQRHSDILEQFFALPADDSDNYLSTYLALLNTEYEDLALVPLSSKRILLRDLISLPILVPGKNEREPDRTYLDKVIMKNRKVLLSGPGGSGKSTALRQALYNVAREQDRTNRPKSVPVLLNTAVQNSLDAHWWSPRNGARGAGFGENRG